MSEVLFIVSAIFGIGAVVYAAFTFFETRSFSYQEFLNEKPQEKPSVVSGEAPVGGIKSFLYLDEYKMYSVSAQIFGGLTDYLIRLSGDTDTELKEQKGKVGSGRVLADIVSKRAGVEEKRFLHDYAYSLFENKLVADGKVLVVDSANLANIRTNLSTATLVKVSGKANFIDVQMLAGWLKDFNEVGAAITYVTNFNALSEARKHLAQASEEAGDRNDKARIRELIKSLEDVSALAEKAGLHQDRKFLDQLAYMLKFGFRDHFEMHVALGDPAGGEILFSSILNREYLRESDTSIIKKYSRQTESQLTVFGVITQRLTEKPAEPVPSETKESAEPKHMKEAILNMVNAITGVEKTFFGKLQNEIVIDPIAVFREL